MNTLFVEKFLKYDGSQLSPHFIYKNFQILGNAMISFVGECDVKISSMVDLEDVINNEPIYSPNMLSFIVEFFNIELDCGVFMQRLLMTIIKETIEKQCNVKVLRQGDDLFVNDKKLSVSIATKSLTSVLVHVGLNITTENTPIKTSGLLSDLNISNIKEFAELVMQTFLEEINDIFLATTKVRGVY